MMKPEEYVELWLHRLLDDIRVNFEGDINKPHVPSMAVTFVKFLEERELAIMRTLKVPAEAMKHRADRAAPPALQGKVNEVGK